MGQWKEEEVGKDELERAMEMEKKEEEVFEEKTSIPKSWTMGISWEEIRKGEKWEEEEEGRRSHRCRMRKQIRRSKRRQLRRKKQ